MVDYADIMDRASAEWEHAGEDYIPSRRRRSQFRFNPDYYHTWINIESIVHETEKAFLIRKAGLEFWLPKRIIRKREAKSFFVHNLTFTKIFNESIRKAQSLSDTREKMGS